MTSAWSWYVIALVAINVIGCVWLLWWTARRRAGDPAPTDTSHVWDGDLTEYNKPLPRWWINLFYLTIVFSVGYLLWYPGLGNFAGYANWSSRAEHDTQKAVADAKLAATFAPFDGKPVTELATMPAALALGRSVFANHCATCHGSSGQGAIGYPNLRDDNWQWGGEPDTVLQTVLNGRQAAMPPWGDTLIGLGGVNAVEDTLAYVRALDKPEAGLNDAATRGKALYEAVCVACHGIDGKGNVLLGSPDLTDDYWLYGRSDASVRQSIVAGRNGVMPAHGELIGETRTRLVVAYVLSLGEDDDDGDDDDAEEP